MTSGPLNSLRATVIIMKLSFLPLVFLGSMGTVSIAKSIACTREAVSDILPKGVSLSFVQHIPKNGTFTVPEGDTGWPIDPINLPELCAIGAMVAGTSTNATFGFGVFLPVEWNGRTLSVNQIHASSDFRFLMLLFLVLLETEDLQGALTGLTWYCYTMITTMLGS